jgi:hypothetical protein
VGVQRLLRLAAISEEFLSALERDPEVAAAAAGVKLTLNEQAILRSIPAGQLRRMVDVFPAPEAGLARELEAQARRAVGAVAARFGQVEPTWPVRNEDVTERAEPFICLGMIEGDRPPQYPVSAPAGLRPDALPERPFDNVTFTGIQPDAPPERPRRGEGTRGTRPGRVVVGAAAALLIGGAVVAKCTGACDPPALEDPAPAEPDEE